MERAKNTGTGTQYPKLHNAMWPGLVGKGTDSEPAIDPDTMLDLTARARVNDVGWGGCMFPNESLLDVKTGELILASMIEVRNAHGRVL